MKKWKIRKKWLIAAFCGVLTAGALAGAYLLWGAKEAESAVVSAGVQQFADQAAVTCAAPVGKNITFSAAWADEALGGAPVAALTVTALPPATDGTLYLGHGAVHVGETVSRDTLSYLSFAANEGVTESAFSFAPATEAGACGFDVTCRLRFYDSVNCCPTGTKSVMAVSTHETLVLTGTLLAVDPEGGQLCFEICDYPKNGTISLNSETGDFTYTPSDGFCGTDAFTWRAQDDFGAYSAPARVDVTVRELKTGYVYADIADNGVQTAALYVSERELLTGETVGKQHYFHPDDEVPRAVFVTVLVQAAGINAPDVNDTGFADDAEIPRRMKGAIKYAKDAGWLGDDAAFRPHAAVTRAEAAAIAAKALDLAAPGYAETVRDFSAIPVGIADAVYALFEGGYITTFADGTLAPARVLTRGDAAKFFARVLDENA